VVSLVFFFLKYRQPDYPYDLYESGAGENGGAKFILSFVRLAEARSKGESLAYFWFMKRDI
jgi:hypothetical protein